MHPLPRLAERGLVQARGRAGKVPQDAARITQTLITHPGSLGYFDLPRKSDQAAPTAWQIICLL